MSTYLQDRVRRAQLLLDHVGAEAVIATSTPNFFYFTGKWIDPHERLLAYVIRRSGDPVLIAPQLHAEDFADYAGDVRLWRDGQDALAVLAECLPDRGVVSIDGAWPSRNLLSFMRLNSTLDFIDSGSTLGKLRLIKDEHEAQLLRAAGYAADRVMKGVMERIKPGIKEYEVVEELKALWKTEGATDLSFAPIVGAGANGALPHHESSNRAIQNGDMVVVDMGGIVDRYCSDTTRTVTVGEASRKMREVHEVVQKAQQAAMLAARPGVSLGDIDRAARDVITQAGFGEYFTHRTGHGLGIEIHEDPYVFAGNTVSAQPGMVFSIEPGIYLPGEFGVRIEDIVMVNEDGCESFNLFPKELLVLS